MSLLLKKNLNINIEEVFYIRYLIKNKRLISKKNYLFFFKNKHLFLKSNLYSLGIKSNNSKHVFQNSFLKKGTT